MSTDFKTVHILYNTKYSNTLVYTELSYLKLGGS